MIRREQGHKETLNGLIGPLAQSRVTAFFVAINVAMFVLLSLTGGSTESANLYRWGAKFGPAIQAGEWYRLFSPVVLHAGLWHLGANTFAMVLFGPRLEREFGWVAFLATYVVAGICGVAASYLVSPALSVGASGAVFGIVGAYGVFLIRNRKDFGVAANPVILNLAIVLVINIVFGLLVPGIDQGAHVGGLIAGAVMGWAVSPRRIVTIEDDFFIFGAPTVRTQFARATVSRTLVAVGLGLILALVIVWWVSNNVNYDQATMSLYAYFELVS